MRGNRAGERSHPRSAARPLAGQAVDRLGPRRPRDGAAAEVAEVRQEQAIDAWNRGDLAGYLTLSDDDVVLHGYGPEPMDKTAVKGFYDGIFTGLPGSQTEVLDAFGSGDRVAARFVQRGQHGGELMGVPPTGRDVEIAGITVLAFRDGRVIERWASADMLGLLVQLGAVPAPGA